MSEGGMDVDDTRDTEIQPTPGPRRLYRSPDDKKLAGVCGGLAEYFGLDPTLVRLAVVLFTLASGIGVLAYIIAAFIVPMRPESVPRQIAPPASLGWGDKRGIAVLIGVTAIALIIVGDWQWWWFSPPLVGVTLVALGVWLLISRDDEKKTPSFATRSAQSTTLVGEAASERDQSDEESTTTDPFSVSDDSAGPRGEVPPPVPPWGPTSPVPPEPAAPGPARSAAGFTALLLIGAGIAALLVVFDVWDLGFEESLGAVLAVLGVALLIGAWFGNARPLLALGLPALGLLVLADTVDLPLSGGTGDRQIEVRSLSDIRTLDRTQELFAGELVIDLDDAPLNLAQARDLDLDVDVGMGQLTIYLPEDVTAHIDADVGMGSIQIDGQDEGGVNVDRSLILDGKEGGGRIFLDLHVGLGEVQVFHG